MDFIIDPYWDICYNMLVKGSKVKLQQADETTCEPFLHEGHSVW